MGDDAITLGISYTQHPGHYSGGSVYSLPKACSTVPNMYGPVACTGGGSLIGPRMAKLCSESKIHGNHPPCIRKEENKNYGR